jgi:predicted Fe-Mo cluster-binding NifX family protein
MIKFILNRINNMPTEKPDQNQSDFPKTSNPAQTALHLAGYYRLEQLTKVTEAELLALHGVGPKAIRILREALAEKGWKFAEPAP